ncbi:type I restriction-modification system subunit M [Denitrificimonas caeni]|uniref:site-specific DNA-methyltransferase (adenine-specific) n=1 Tax=Denitrificimonas caeni TaxID=521720 RepID=A0AAE9VS14_9GAMM|nr:class I SAM-dependent DNA methyltransferase [Denitrificimonas caeni]WBE26358.1 class I SAM-dependent DNA methyltransferase [Denitrificimonas caeni]
MTDKVTANNLASYCWSIADLLRGDFRQSQYGRIILPFTLLRRLEGVLEASKAQVLAKYAEIQPMNLPEEAQEKLLLRATQINGHTLSFYNVSKMDLSKLGQDDIKSNLESYIQGFSKDAREIFEYFNFAEFLGQLNDADLLFKVVQRVRQTDLSPKAVSNHDMGLVFEELIRRFAESSNDTAGEHFTPRDIVRLTTALVFMEDDDALTKPGIIRTIYDPTAGTGGFLSSGMEYVHELNPQAVMRAYGQELNPESYAICKADMLIKGQDVSNIKLGNTLSNDQLYADKFDYMLSNPPFGVDWKKIESSIKDEHTLKGFDGRFGPGLPRVSDGSLLFLMHLISKLRDSQEGDVQGGTNVAGGRTPGATGGRIGIILNGSPLFTGGAGSGESEIRRYLLEADLVEAIIGLPTDMFYNTGIATYVWVLSNKKRAERKGKVQLINGVNLYSKMRKSLGSKRNEMSESDIATIIRSFGAFTEEEARDLDKPADVKSNRGRQSANPKAETAKTFASKIFDNHAFGYRRITIERPLRESYQFSDERIAELRFDDKQLNAPMQWVYDSYGQNWSDNPECEHYGVFNDEQAIEIRGHIKTNFSDLKEAKIKELLERKTWLDCKQLMQQAKQLQAEIGNAQHDDMNGYAAAVKAAMQAQDLKIATRELKLITAAVSWKNPAAEKVIKKVHKAKPNPLYGLFDVNGKTIEYQPDSELRDNENVALDPSQSVDALNEAYFIKEVQPHVPDAWIDASKKDAKDEQIGIVGYEIPFNRHFYEYQPPRDLAEIDADLDAVSAEIMALLQEVHS